MQHEIITNKNKQTIQPQTKTIKRKQSKHSQSTANQQLIKHKQHNQNQTTTNRHNKNDHPQTKTNNYKQHI